MIPLVSSAGDDAISEMRETAGHGRPNLLLAALHARPHLLSDIKGQTILRASDSNRPGAGTTSS